MKPRLAGVETVAHDPTGQFAHNQPKTSANMANDCLRHAEMTLAAEVARAGFQAPRMSWVSRGLSTWANHSARLAARRRPRSSSGNFNWRNRLVTSPTAVARPLCRG